MDTGIEFKITGSSEAAQEEALVRALVSRLARPRAGEPAAGSSGNEKVLHTFTGVVDGGGPYGSLLRDSTGNLFGTASYGGKNGGGVLFVLH